MQAVEFQPLTTDRWRDFEKLFGKNGACAGCWCMWWRLRRSEWERRKGQSNKRAFKRLAASGRPLGIHAYADNEPVGWCAVGLRETLGALDRSRVLAPVPLPENATPVWSISCFFIARPFRRKHLGTKLLKAAAAYGKLNEATVVEGYPTDPKGKNYPDAFAFMGLLAAFKKAGFQEVARRSQTRLIVRYRIRRGKLGPRKKVPASR